MIILICLFLIGVLCVSAGPALYDPWDFITWSAGMVAGITLGVALVMLPVERMNVHNTIAEFESMRTTQKQSRAAGDGLEGTAWRLEKARANRNLASLQYWNDTLFDIWIPDAVETVEPLK